MPGTKPDPCICQLLRSPAVAVPQAVPQSPCDAENKAEAKEDQVTLVHLRI